MSKKLYSCLALPSPYECAVYPNHTREYVPGQGFSMGLTSLFQLQNLVHPITWRLHTFDTLCEKFDIPSHLFHFYLQVRHFFFSKFPTLTLDKPTTFEYLCTQGPHQLHLISSIHRILHESTPLTETTHHYMRRWSHLLSRPVTVQMWDRIWSSIFKSSKCVTQRETSIKILMFWYEIPDIIHKYNPSVSACCWCCKTDIGSLFHIFWHCSLIQPLAWCDATNTEGGGCVPPARPLNCLLGLPFSGLTKRDNRLISYILLAAKRLIPLCWLSAAPPPWSRFLHLVVEIRRMEFLTASVHDSISHFDKVWEPWDRSEYGTPMLTATSWFLVTLHQFLSLSPPHSYINYLVPF